MKRDCYFQAFAITGCGLWVFLLLFSFLSTTFGFYDLKQPVKFLFVVSYCLLGILCLFAFGVSSFALAKSGKRNPWLIYGYEVNVPVFIVANLVGNGIYHHYFGNSVNPFLFVGWGLWGIASLILFVVKTKGISPEEWRANAKRIQLWSAFDFTRNPDAIRRLNVQRGQATMVFFYGLLTDLFFIVFGSQVSLWLLFIRYEIDANPILFSLDLVLWLLVTIGCAIAYGYKGLKGGWINPLGWLPMMIRGLIFLGYCILVPLLMDPISAFSSVQGLVMFNGLLAFVGMVSPYLFYWILYPATFFVIAFGKLPKPSETSSSSSENKSV